MVGIYKLNVSARLESVENFAISERNKELIVDFIDYCFSEGLGEHRIQREGNIKDSTSTIAAKETEGNEKTPGFELMFGLVSLLGVFLKYRGR